jgi:autotransporter adhesin
VTLINTPQVWQIDPVSNSAELVHDFSDAISAMGIAKYVNDVFAVVSKVDSLTLRLKADAKVLECL